MTTLVSYNILAGGYSIHDNDAPRTQQLLSIIRSANPDIVGLAEATQSVVKQKSVVIEELAEALDRGRAGGAIRRRESGEILRILAPARAQGVPHVIMGDFNSLAPGDRFHASSLVSYILDIEREKSDPHLDDGHPQLRVIVPPALRFVKPILRIIPRSQLISTLFNSAASLYAPRDCIQLLRDANYVDCYRRIHPQALGFTCPAAAPAGRIDFIFASPQMADRLETCYVLKDGEGVQGSEASDHLAVAAEFGSHTQPTERAETFAQVAVN